MDFCLLLGRRVLNADNGGNKPDSSKWSVLVLNVHFQKWHFWSRNVSVYFNLGPRPVLVLISSSSRPRPVLVSNVCIVIISIVYKDFPRESANTFAPKVCQHQEDVTNIENLSPTYNYQWSACDQGRFVTNIYAVHCQVCPFCLFTQTP